LALELEKNIGWKDISIWKKSSREPDIIRSENGKDKVKNLGFSAMKLSISHIKTLAQAMVILIK
jgi:phosphopantetheinyl transferase (holo-ACP synthase)